MRARALLPFALLTAGCHTSGSGSAAGDVSTEAELVAAARRIHADALVIETHSDTTPKFESEWDFSARHGGGHMDIPRIREGGLDAVFFSIWMGPTPGDGAAVKRAVRRIDSVHEAVRRWPDELALATTAAEIRDAARTGKIACLIGIEGGHIIENELAALRTYYRLGARYMTLTHSFNTEWADSAGTDRPVPAEHGGLSGRGVEIVREMNRLGMMVDVSHVSDEAFWDALEASEAPLIATHSSCRAIADHPRNMSDEMIVALAERGGVIQINFYDGYIDPAKTAVGRRLLPEIQALYERYPDDPGRAREERIALVRANDPGPTDRGVIVDHIQHVIELVGADHVGLGADWDGVPSMPVGMEDCSKLEYVTLELLRRGYDEETVRKVLGDNVLRLMEEVETVAVRLRART